ncbi:universal stress protein, partial [Brevundimonas sp.]|uniref:universal stress protein n=1 Tax=Brevundimonas sp. TaxID=1871086 RepID=UPI0027F22CB3
MRPLVLILCLSLTALPVGAAAPVTDVARLQAEFRDEQARARRLRADGTDVVVGCVETHGREETTTLLQGLEVLPRRAVERHGELLQEFDLDGALARKPAVLILDELAHANVEGGRHPKRWQDALELLEAGIEVWTTLNVQHVESLNDVVAQITFVRVRETVPDAVLDSADELELVDLPPEQLLERFREGKVYLPEPARRAADSFFRRGNLLALRELALRRTAERVDAEVSAYRHEHRIGTTWPAGERILVCVGPSPTSGSLIRGGRRMAAGLRAPWIAAYVEAPGAFAMTGPDRDRLHANLRLAESLGGEVVRLTGASASGEILRYAREHNVTRIVVGKPTHRRWRDVLRGSFVSELVRGSGTIEVHFIAGDQGEAGKAPARPAAADRRIDW